MQYDVHFDTTEFTWQLSETTTVHKIVGGDFFL